MPTVTEPTPPPAPSAASSQPFLIQKERTRLFGLTWDECIQTFFGGNALMAVVILGLITIFLFREGAQFFGQNAGNLRIYRQAGLEYVDFIRQQEQDHTALTRYLFGIRMQAVEHLTKVEKLSIADANARLAAFDDFSGKFSDTVTPIRGFVSDLGEVAVDIKTKYTVAQDRITERDQLIDAGKIEEAKAVKIEDVDFKSALAPIVGTLPMYKEASEQFAQSVRDVLAQAPALPVPSLEPKMERFKQLTQDYLATFPETLRRMETWDYNAPIPAWKSFTTFVTGSRWLTASFWQDWYGIVPLFTGSLLISAIALALAVPLGVGAAIYVNQIATPLEQRLIKPAIEFISAIPSVVLGFFGIAVLGQALRAFSQVPWMDWFPGFPFPERLNALTAGCLLGLIAVPTIFTLAEDAINNVPRAFKEASFALGASRMQTVIRIIVPASLSGIISAILLGLGRVIGETMVVLLCAGNRIAIPDFSAGLGVITQPVHTMTGIIAQEMGEVAQGSIHYRALFVVGMVLFFLALLINYLAQKIVRKYRISIG